MALDREELQERLAALERQIEEMQAAENDVGEAGARSQRALLYALAGDLKKAAAEVAKVGTLAAGAEQVDVLAKAHLAKGKALAAQPGKRQQAADALKKAAALYEAREEYPAAADALKELAGILAATGETAEAIRQLGRALEMVDGSGTPEQAIDLYRARAVCCLLAEDVGAATADFEEALALAAGDYPQLAVEIRLQRQLLAEGTDAQALAALQQQAQQVGHLPVVGDVRLQRAAQALADGRFPAARQLAQKARHAARDGDDLTAPLRYLHASLLLAEAHEMEGDRPAVLAALLTCRTFLSHRLGDDVGAQIDHILDALAQRWGRQATADAIAAYRRQAQEEGPFSV